MQVDLHLWEKSITLVVLLLPVEVLSFHFHLVAVLTQINCDLRAHFGWSDLKE